MEISGKKKLILVFLFIVFFLTIITLATWYLRVNPFVKYTKKQVQSKLVQKTNIIQSSLKQDFKTYFLDLLLDEKSGTLTKISAEQTNASHPPALLPEKPANSDGYFIFKTELITNNDELLYTTWNKLPKQPIADKPGSFKFIALVPYQPQTILRVYSSDGKVIFTEVIR